MPSEAQKRAHQKHEATREKRVALWLSEKDAKQIDKLKDLWRLPSRAAVVHKMIGRMFGK